MCDIDVEALRALTPGCANRNHLNNAGAALLSSATIAAMTEAEIDQAVDAREVCCRSPRWRAGGFDVESASSSSTRFTAHRK